MNKKNNQKGITLIALIITIIVMLILVAVTITVAVKGGLFEYAGRAATKTNEAIDEEQLLASGKIKVNEIWYDSIDAYIAGEKAYESWPAYSEELLDETTGMLTENTKYTDTNKKVAVIPKGFMLTDVEDEIDKGIVIEDASNNQYVWVPVADGTLDREAWFLDNLTGSEFVTKMNNGDYTNDQLKEKLATYYATNGGYDAYPTLEEAMSDQGIESIDEYLEACASDWNYMEGDSTNIEDIKTALTGICTLGAQYTETIPTELVASVAKYKGFYIARYEAGSEDPRTYEGKDTLTEVITKQGLYPYNFVSQTNAVAKIGEMYSDKNTYGVVATLPYGAQWDETMKFVKTEKDVTNSTAWGNYNNNPFTFTGACDENQAKNIYDLAGNVYEWTMEANSSTNPVSRGGSCDDDGGVFPASSRFSNNPADSNGKLGFRPTLYIK